MTAKLTNGAHIATNKCMTMQVIEYYIISLYE